jgi:hypothetical protein
MPAVIGVLSALKTRRRELVPVGLAEGVGFEIRVRSSSTKVAFAPELNPANRVR